MFGLLVLLLVASVGAGPAGTAAGVVTNPICADGVVPHEYMVTLRSPGPAEPSSNPNPTSPTLTPSPSPTLTL